MELHVELFESSEYETPSKIVGVFENKTAKVNNKSLYLMTIENNNVYEVELSDLRDYDVSKLTTIKERSGTTYYTYIDLLNEVNKKMYVFTGTPDEMNEKIYDHLSCRDG